MILAAKILIAILRVLSPALASWHPSAENFSTEGQSIITDDAARDTQVSRQPGASRRRWVVGKWKRTSGPPKQGTPLSSPLTGETTAGRYTAELAADG